MDNILEELGLGDHMETFLINSITPRVVINMTDPDFNSVGITRIGDRVQLRERCRDHLAADGIDSPVMNRILNFQAERSQKGKRFKVSKPKETRKVTIGWIHNGGNGKKRIVAGKGGGKQDIDIDKNLTYDQILKVFTDRYFPNGVNQTTGIQLEDLSCYVATYTGQPVLEIISPVSFSFGELLNQLKASPIRLYLHTELKASGSDTVAENVPIQLDTSDDDFVDADTPTVRIRRRLTLRRRPGTNSQSSGNPVSTISTSDIQPPEISEIISVNEDKAFDFSRDDITLEQLLDHWMERTLKDVDSKPQELVVFREKILSSAIRAMTRASFEFDKPFAVVFTGELGDDQGGPKREFLAELMSAVNEDILEGPDEFGKLFKHDLVKLENKKFEISGKMVSFCILHGGTGLPCLNPSLYKLMTGREETTFNLHDIADMDVKDHISQIQKSSTQSEYNDAILKNSDWLIEQGILAETLMKNYIFYRIHSEITQFIAGINHVGNFFHDIVMKAPLVSEPLFVCTGEKLTLLKFRDMYVVDYSEEGSNRRRKENNVVYCFEAFLADCEGGATGIPLSEVLGFWTGATMVPPLGFPKKLEISFMATEERRLPTAHTCGMVLDLWLGYEDPENFAEDMILAITWGKGFHLA